MDKTGEKQVTRFSLTKRKQDSSIIGLKKDEKVDGEKELLISIGEDGVKSLNGKKNENKVIPKQENSWRPEKRMKSIYVPETEGVIDGGEDRFVKETIEAGPDAGVQYGLNLRKSENNQQDEENPIFDDDRFKMEVLDLPDEANIDAYDSMPIEDFGAAMLRGMGWEKGKSIGRNGKAPVEPVEFIPRVGRLGLGATPKPVLEPEKKKIRKPGDEKIKKLDLVAAPSSDGRIHHIKKSGEKLVERLQAGPVKGKIMRIIGGSHAGLKGEVLLIEEKDKNSSRSQRVQINLLSSEETVKIRVQDLADIGSLDEERFFEEERKKQKEEKSRKKERIDGEQKYRQKERQEAVEPKKVNGWLRNHLRVRVVDKKVGKGKIYLKKGTIVDVLSPTICDVMIDDFQKLFQLEEKMLETVLPKRGGRVVVVVGKFSGQVGKLLARDLDTGVATVQLADNFDVLNVDLDMIAEYVGDITEGEG